MEVWVDLPLDGIADFALAVLVGVRLAAGGIAGTCGRAGRCICVLTLLSLLLLLLLEEMEACR